MSLSSFLKTAVKDVQESVSKEEIDRRYQERIQASQDMYARNETIWAEKSKVLATVKQRGPRRWAYEIKALQEAGFYTDLHGIAMADKVIKMDEYRGEE